MSAKVVGIGILQCDHCHQLFQTWSPHYCSDIAPRHVGAVPANPLTEDDVRRIVREELAKRGDPLTLRIIGGKP